jgi:hypothetical protein
VLDITYAYVYFGLILGLVNARSLFQSIAAGLLGRASYQGGAGTVLLGAVLHLFIAFTWAFAYFVVVRRAEPLRRVVRTTGGRVMVGLLYGLFAYLVMTLVVVPLSQVHSHPHLTLRFWINLVQHMLMVGLPIVLIIGDGGD